jgi:hypothetical protein
MAKRELSQHQRASLLSVLQKRFAQHMHRHQDLVWTNALARLEKKADPATLWSLQEMERTGGEPDVVGHDTATGEYIFFDCSAESPKGRRSVCYDSAALNARKLHKPKDSALGMAEAMGIAVLTEEEYRTLQAIGEFDMKTSSWIATPAPIRKRGGALFGDRRYDAVFIYHNGAESYYAARGFRGSLRV